MSTDLSESLERRLAWILGDEPRAHGGLLASWVHPERHGFAYAEATGFAIRTLVDVARRRDDAAMLGAARALGDALARAMSPEGGFGRDEWLYAFDTAVCAAALSDAGHATEARLATGFAARCLSHQQAAEPRDPDRPEEIGARWSTHFGPHMIKAAALLEGDGAPELAEAMAQELAATHFHDGRFHTGPDRSETYVHQHCYALEGLWRLARLGRTGQSDFLEEGVEWLAAMQQADGSLPRWWRADGGASGRAGDATAQAVRLWGVTDPQRYADRIAVGLGFLATLELPTGGIRYSGEHAEANVWTTLFAIQAELIATLGPTASCIA